MLDPDFCDTMGKALSAICESLLSEGFAKDIVNSATDAPYKDEYCCVVIVSGRLIKSHPDTATRITRAILKARNDVQFRVRVALQECKQFDDFQRRA